VKANIYELISHTADIGIRLKANSLEDVFCSAASAMFDIMAKTKSPVKIKQSLDINLTADSYEDLLVYWLNELLSLSQVKQLVFSGFVIKELKKNKLKAVVEGRALNSYTINTEIKAATFHGLKLTQIKGSWQLELIFDV